MTIWTTYTIEPATPYHWTIGPLDLWLERDECEWRCLTGKADDESIVVIDNQPKPDDKEWGRWAVKDPVDSLKILPILPDRPMIARPQTPLKILPGQDARFFVSVPLWVKLVLVQGNTEIVLNEWPALTLSSSWSGTPVEGELCYALKTRARRFVDDIEAKPFRAICPIVIKNKYELPLTFERLCLQGAYLNVYQGDQHMWTSEGTFVYKGPLQTSSVTFGDDAPAFDNASTIVGNARKEGRNMVVRSFDNLKSFTFG